MVAQRTSRVHPVNSAMIPSVEDAIQIYMNAGGTITRDSSFGIDPDVTKTGNGEWGMGNGEWGMGNGEWGMGNGKLKMGNEKLKMGT